MSPTDQRSRDSSWERFIDDLDAPGADVIADYPEDNKILVQYSGRWEGDLETRVSSEYHCWNEDTSMGETLIILSPK